VLRPPAHDNTGEVYANIIMEDPNLFGFCIFCFHSAWHFMKVTQKTKCSHLLFHRYKYRLTEYHPTFWRGLLACASAAATVIHTYAVVRITKLGRAFAVNGCVRFDVNYLVMYEGLNSFRQLLASCLSIGSHGTTRLSLDGFWLYFISSPPPPPKIFREDWSIIKTWQE
jgi:hypothetical protein